MKLRNKETGEIGELCYVPTNYLCVTWTKDDGVWTKQEYNSLAELNEDWEDYEEPKEHWAIDQFGEPINVTRLSRLQLAKLHRFGNDFPSEDATIEAIEKLEAWQRLKDHNLRVERGQRIFVNAANKLTSQKPLFVMDTYEEVEDDLDLLFGDDDDDDYMPTNAEINDLTDIGYGG